LREHSEDIKKNGFQIVVIVPHNGEFVQEFLDAFDPYPFPIYGDPERKAYKDMGHKSMSKGKLLVKSGVGVLKGKVKELLPEKSEQKSVVKKSMTSADVSIQGGTWLFDDNGEVLWNHIDESPEDHADAQEIVQETEKHRGS